MAIYLRVPPGSKGRQCQRDGQSSPPLWVGANGATGRPASPQLQPDGPGLGYLNLPMAPSQAVGDSGKCSPAALASVCPRPEAQRGLWIKPCFYQLPAAYSRPLWPALPAPLAWAFGLGPMDWTVEPTLKAALGARWSE